VLNAEQELLNSQVTLVSAQHDAYVAGFALLNAMGKVDAASVGVDGGVLYDPTVNYKRSKVSYSDWRDGPAPKPQSTPTAGGTTTAVTPPAN
jgi:outer membrane protein